MAATSGDTAEAGHDLRWAAWVERNRQDDLAFTRTLGQRLLTGAAIGLLVAVAILSLTGGR